MSFLLEKKVIHSTSLIFKIVADSFSVHHSFAADLSFALILIGGELGFIQYPTVSADTKLEIQIPLQNPFWGCN